MKTKKTLYMAILAVLLVFLNGCAAKGSRRGWGLRSVVAPPILTVVLMNNTVVPVEIYENGQPVEFKDSAGNYRPAVLEPGGVVSRGYYNFLGRRDVIITVRGICPPTPLSNRSRGCTPGQYAGTDSRRFTIYTDGQYHTVNWEINYLRGPRGVY